MGRRARLEDRRLGVPRGGPAHPRQRLSRCTRRQRARQDV